VYKPEREPVTGPWTDYRPQQRWTRIDDLPADLPERPYGAQQYVYSGGGSEPPIAFAKAQVDGPGRLAASVYNVTYSREEARRTDYADYTDGKRRIRLRGVRSALSLGNYFSVDLDAPASGKWNPREAPLMPLDLASWRILRDAGESGLRAGESMTIGGVWIFDRFFGVATRKTEYR
jgi:hypothetical protein